MMRKIGLLCVIMLLAAMPFARASDAEIPALPDSSFGYSSFTINFEKGWNLFSVPIHTNDFATIFKTKCVGNPLYHFEPTINDYNKEGTMTAGGKIAAGMKGYWYKADRSCSVTVRGSSQVEVARELKTGWNQIGAPKGNAKWDEIKGTCSATSGPYKFNTAAYKWEKSENLKAGEGHFVKVSSDCTLGSQNPPSPPETENFDLGITSVQFSNYNPSVGESVTITANVYNYGSRGGYLNGYGISYEGPGVGSAGTAPKATKPGIYIGAGQSHQLTFTTSFQYAGNWRVKVSLSPEDDYNSGNNEYSQSISVGNINLLGFDPAISDISFSNTNPKAGESFTVKVTVLNSGDTGGYISKFSLNYFGGGEGTNVGGGYGFSEGGNRYLGPGESHVYSASQSLPTGGYWTATASITAQDDINAANNVLNKQIYVAPMQQNCVYIGDGTYYSVAIDCKVISTSGHQLMLKDVSAFSPQRAQFDIVTADGSLIKRFYLGEGESTTVAEAGNLNIQVIKVYPGAFAKKGLATFSVKSNYQQGTQFSRMFYDLIVHPQHDGSPSYISLYDSSRVKGTQSGNNVIAAYEDWIDWDWNDLKLSTSHSVNQDYETLDITLQQCETAALDKTLVAFTFDSTKQVEIQTLLPSSDASEKYIGKYVTLTLWEQCQGHVGEVKRITIKNPVPSCTESDGGDDLYNRGTTSGLEIGTSNQVSRTDYCLNTNQVVEYYCNELYSPNQPGYVNNGVKSCPTNAPYCVSGACIAMQNSTPTPSPLPSAFTPQFYDIYVRNNYWATPSLVQLFNPNDRWRFIGAQSGDDIALMGMEDSLNIDTDYNDLAFNVNAEGISQVDVTLTACDTAAANALSLKMVLPGAYSFNVVQTGATVTGVNSEIPLWADCHGHIGETRTVLISAANST